MARPNYSSNGSIKEELSKVKLSKESIKENLWVFKYIIPYRFKFILGLVLIALSGVTTMAFPYLLKELIDNAHQISLGKDAIAPGLVALTMLGVLSIQMVFSFSRVYLFSFVGEHAVADLRKDIYKQMIMMPMEFFAQRRVGELSNRLSADISQIQDTVSSVLAELLRGLVVLLIGIGLIFYLSWKLTLVMLSVVPVIVVVAVVFSRRIRKESKDAQDQLADSGVIVQETLQGIANVKAFSNEAYELKRYSISVEKVVKLAIKSAQLRGIFISIMIFSIFAAIVMVVWYGTSILQFGELTAFVVYTAFIGGSMAGFAELYSQLQKTLGATQRVKELFGEVTENVNIKDEPVQEAFRIEGTVELKHVAFSYPSRPEIQILKDVSFKAGLGQQIAIVGPSGAGKSTLVSLLLGFYNPAEGALLFDGKDAGSYPLSQLRKQMAFVPQDVLLFGGTIFENIAYGKPDATGEEVEEAARKAYAHGFISSFPEGYNTVVGERGVKLSGGQRQRVAIARAILKDPAILILDEATSSLDSESELLVQKALDSLMKGRTSIVIAHRLSTIRNADKIVVLEKGLVKECGTHDELIHLDNGLYRNLNKLQFELS
ncbi:xenobiotic-transporting ATPase [Sporocytophaga myxococcoides]|uniref:Xenobiotic-transporting ATPase n=1 Tax=Sporocytophaga myxococcoides TaxID=153721 RepID=A0A098LF58_9BACT|nr:ABC transporter transmembrane domain-containing protein [Sporocytophaga myxococcoides]GAL85611.1 xenobiotic-transporting ATPase [Sporocytophaga myxococcoides]